MNAPAPPSANRKTRIFRLVATVFRNTFSVALGYIPIGFAFGAYAVSQDFPIWLTITSAVVIYAGSMEFTAVGLISSGIGLWQIALTTLFINFRHIFYGLSFPLQQVKSPLGRLYCIHALTDEAYALATSGAITAPPKPLTKTSTSKSSSSLSPALAGKEVFLSTLFCQLYWVSGVTIGAIVGANLPIDTSFLEFALPALFICLAIEALRSASNYLRKICLLALPCAGLGLAFGKEYMLIVSLFSYTFLLLLWNYFRPEVKEKLVPFQSVKLSTKQKGKR